MICSVLCLKYIFVNYNGFVFQKESFNNNNVVKSDFNIIIITKWRIEHSFTNNTTLILEWNAINDFNLKLDKLTLF